MGATQGGGTVYSLAATLERQLNAGTPARATLGSKDAAFAWTTGQARGFWTFVDTVSVEGGSFTALKVGVSATPPAKVAEGAAKPNAVSISSAPIALAKYAGLAEFSLEKAVYSDVLVQAVTQTLINGALAALEADAATAALAGASETLTTPTSWTSAVLEAIGAVASNGGTPNLLVMSPADFAAAVEGAVGLSFGGSDAILTFLGLQVHLSPTVTAGTGLVMDSRAMLIGESIVSPTVVVDPFSKADLNITRVVAEVMAAPAVVAGGSVVKITPTIAALGARSGKHA